MNDTTTSPRGPEARDGQINEPGQMHDPATVGFTRRVLLVVAIVGLSVILGAIFLAASDIFFLFFASILVAIILRAASDALARRTGMGPRWALAAVVTALLGLSIAAVAFFGGSLSNQINDLIAKVPESADQAREKVKSYPWGDEALSWLPTLRKAATNGTGDVASRVATFFSTTLGVLGNLLVLVFMSIYLAMAPEMYVEGVVTLVPPRRRDRARQVLTAIGNNLRWWLGGRLVAMLAVGLIVGLGLWLVGLEQYVVLAVVAAVLSAVPYVGPIAGAAPGILLALMKEPTAALWATGVYVLAQAVENYLVTPLVQQQTVKMAPVVTIAAVVLIGSLTGVLGLIVATPLAVAIQVAVRMIYVEDVLGDDMKVEGA
jgi:predicted PurR-regulated permease PerM